VTGELKETGQRLLNAHTNSLTIGLADPTQAHAIVWLSARMKVPTWWPNDHPYMWTADSQQQRTNDTDN